MQKYIHIWHQITYFLVIFDLLWSSKKMIPDQFFLMGDLHFSNCLEVNFLVLRKKIQMQKDF